MNATVKPQVGGSIPPEVTSDALAFAKDEANKAFAAAQAHPQPIDADGGLALETAVLTNKYGAQTNPITARRNAEALRAIKEVRGVKTWSGDEIVDNINALREESSDAFKAGDSALGDAKKSLADALERLLDRNVDPSIVPAMRAARQRLAKIRDVEKALVEGPDSAEIRGRTLANSRSPLSGGLEDVADFSRANPNAVKLPSQIGHAPGGNVLTDTVIGGLGMAITGHPLAAVGAFFGRPGARELLERAYERAATKGERDAARAAAQALAIMRSGTLTDAKAQIARKALQTVYQFVQDEYGRGENGGQP